MANHSKRLVTPGNPVGKSWEGTFVGTTVHRPGRLQFVKIREPLVVLRRMWYTTPRRPDGHHYRRSELHHRLVLRGGKGGYSYIICLSAAEPG